MKLTAIATTCALLLTAGTTHAKDTTNEKVDHPVTITGNDTMKFEDKAFVVKAGS